MDLANTADDRRRFFIVGAGRTGSSLLAAVLADAGATFGMAYRENWNPRSGAYEHPIAGYAYTWQVRAERIENSPLPNWLRKFCKRRARYHLQLLLEQVRYVKTSTLIWLAQPAHRLGYCPVVIVSYRAFAGYARSRYIRFGWSLPRLADSYYETYSTALLQLDIWGGCAVDYEELTNVAETRWADALAQITGLSREALLKARESRLKPDAKAAGPLLFDPAPVDGRAAAVYNRLASLKGQVVEPAASGR